MVIMAVIHLSETDKIYGQEGMCVNWNIHCMVLIYRIRLERARGCPLNHSVVMRKYP